MDRSIFLKQLSAIAAASIICPSSVIAKPYYLRNLLPEVGIQLFSLPFLLNKNFEKSISMISQMGYTYLEFFGPYYFSSQRAWRIIQIGGVASVSPARARSIGLAFSMVGRFQWSGDMSSVLLLKAASCRSKREL